MKRIPPVEGEALFWFEELKSPSPLNPSIMKGAEDCESKMWIALTGLQMIWISPMSVASKCCSEFHQTLRIALWINNY